MTGQLQIHSSHQVAMNASRCFHPLSAFSLTASVIEDCHDQVRKMSLADFAGERLVLLFLKRRDLCVDFMRVGSYFAL